MKLTVTIQGTFSDGQKFSFTVDNDKRSIKEVTKRVIDELEMVEANEHAFDHLQSNEG